MAKYKVLKAVAHNVGHSFLSDMNYVGTGSRFTMVPELIFQTARKERVTAFHLDLINQVIEPEAFDIPEINESAGYYRKMLWNQVDNQGADPAFVRAADLWIRFDLESRRTSRYVGHAELPVFSCEVTIIDDRGHSHVGRPDHWWQE